MRHYDIDTVLGWRGDTVRGGDGEKIGTVGDVFLDRRTDRPGWIGVRTGWFGSGETYVPLGRAEAEGGEIRVPYDKELVKSAPRIDPDVALTPEEEEILYRHYGEAYEPHADADALAQAPAKTARAPRSPDGDGEAMTRSEEEPRLGHVERRPTERVRIKKVVVTENVKKVVPVEREVVELEHDPPPADATRPADDPRPRG